MSGRLDADSKVVDAIKIDVFLTETTQMRSFVGPCNVYGRFIKAFSRNSRPRNDILRKNKELNWSDLTTEA